MEIPYIVVFIYEHSPQFSILLFGVVMAMAAQSGDNNSRVSRIEVVLKEIEFIKHTNTRIERKLDKAIGDHERRLRTAEANIGSLKERFKIISGLQAAWATLLGVIAAWWGAQR